MKNSLLKSSAFFLSNFFKNRHYTIVFYYPAHFNRGPQGQNRFFEPLYELCEKNGIDYLIIEEPELFKKTIRDERAQPFDLPLVLILLLRKWLPLKNYDSFQQREWRIARILRPLLFRKFHFDHFVVLSNSMLGFFRGLEPEAKLYDYQHGLIFSNHTGYFSNDGKPAEHILSNDVHLLLHGEGFHKVLLKSDGSDYYRTHTHILGQDSNVPTTPISSRKKIIAFSLQFTCADEFGHAQQEWLDIIDRFLSANEKFFTKENIRFRLKHHPRFNDCMDLSSLERFPFVSFFDGGLDEFFDETFLHLTFYSTTLFDAAARDIPTILWKHDYSYADIFIDDFDYPLGVTETTEIVPSIARWIRIDEKYESMCHTIHRWYRTIFSPLNEEVFLSLFRGSHEKN